MGSSMMRKSTSGSCSGPPLLLLPLVALCTLLPWCWLLPLAWLLPLWRLGLPPPEPPAVAERPCRLAAVSAAAGVLLESGLCPALLSTKAPYGEASRKGLDSRGTMNLAET